jgi:hypothetical protein
MADDGLLESIDQPAEEVAGRAGEVSQHHIDGKEEN